MSNALQLPKGFGNIAPIFNAQPTDNALSEGIVGGFSVIGYKGKVWSVRAGGKQHDLMRDDGSGPVNGLDVVIVKASPAISKTYYEQQYTDGSNMPPDCWSNNGVTPDATAIKKQNTVCATCRHNFIGSVTTAGGKKAKACQDRKRLAVVPEMDLLNEIYGGPMLLSVPPTSLGPLMQFDLMMRNMGFPHYSFATRIIFDTAESYPRFKYQALRALTPAEAEIVMSLRADPRTDRIIGFAETAQTLAEAAAVSQETAAAPAPAPTAAPAEPQAEVTPGVTPDEPKPVKRRAGRPAKALAKPEPAQPAEEEEEEANSSVGIPDSIDQLLEDLLPTR